MDSRVLASRCLAHLYHRRCPLFQSIENSHCVTKGVVNNYGLVKIGGRRYFAELWGAAELLNAHKGGGEKFFDILPQNVC